MKTRLLLLPALVAASLAQVACDPQVGPDYKGEPLATLRGDVSGVASSTNASVAVLWLSASEELACSGPTQACSSSVGGSVDDFDCIANCSEAEAACGSGTNSEYIACVEACGGEAFFEASWEVCADTAIGEMVAVTGQFPAQFQLDLFQPPPAMAMLSSDDAPNVALGFFVAADPDAGPIELSADTETPPAAILGGSETHMLMYTDGEVLADTPWASILGGAYGPGYHILEVNEGTEQCEGGGCEYSSATLQPAQGGLAAQIGLRLARFEDIAWPAIG